MTLDEVEDLSRRIRTANASVRFGHPKYTSTIDSQSLLRLLTAIDAMLPVVKAAHAFTDYGNTTEDDEPMMIVAVVRALDAMQAALALEGRR